MNKICTSIEQSKKLMELGIDVNTADMTYRPIMDIDSMSNSGFLDMPDCYPFNEFKDCYIKPLPCWSLSALYALLPERTDISKAYSDDCVTMEYWCWTIMSEAEDECDSITETANYDNPVDACVEMVIKLKEKNLL